MKNIFVWCQKVTSLTARFLVVSALIFFNPLCSSQPEKDIAYLFSLTLEELLEVEVTIASLFPESELEVASTVTLITPNDWRSRGDRRSSDALSHQPSVLALPIYGGGHVFSTRGYAHLSQSRGIATLIDGVAVNDVFFGSAQLRMGNWNLGTLDRIEMIRGPGSAIYGAAAFHGVVSYHTFESQQDITWLHAQGASNAYGESSLRYSVGLTDNSRLNLAVSTSGQGAQDNKYGFTDPVSGVEGQGQRNNEYLSQTAVIKVQGKTHAGYDYRVGFYHDQFDAQQAVGLGRIYGASQAKAQDDSGGDTTFDMVSGAITNDLGAHIAAELSAYYWQDYVWGETNPGNLGGDRWILVTKDHNSGVKLSFKQSKNDWQTKWVAQLQLDRIKLDEAEFDTLLSDGSSAGVFAYSTQGRARTTKSVALQADTAFYNDALHLVYGGRLDSYSDFGDQQSPRVGIIYHPDKKSAVKVLYGEAFRPPNFLELASTTTDLQPELITTYELVYMKQFTHWKTEWVLFDSRWHDRIVLNDFSVATGDFANIGVNQSRGLEVLFNWVGDTWSSAFNLSYVKSEDLEANFVYQGFPKLIFNWDLTHHLPQFNAEITMSNQVLHDMHEGSIIVNAVENTQKIKDYWRTDVTFSQNWSDQWQMRFSIRNALDRRNYLPSIVSSENGVLAEGLSISLALDYKM